MRLSQTEFALAWLAQFQGQDLELAHRLVDEILLVSRNELHRGLGKLLDRIMASRTDPTRPTALYAERAVDVTKEGVQPIFPGTEWGRATGAGVPPVIADPDNQEIGSEGTIANLITDYCRHHEGAALPHPGPDQLRASRVGTIVLVADFIGSGKRVWQMLEAFWRVATIRSWHSYKLVKFVVIAYSGTEPGLNCVRAHRIRPQVLTVAGCPTIYQAFRGADLKAITSMCKRFARGDRGALGFRSGGALIAFAHGMPNNAPAMLHRTREDWTPLFRNRSALSAEYDFPDDMSKASGERAKQLLRINNARHRLTDPEGHHWVPTMLVLAALEKGCRSVQSVSAEARLPIAAVEKILGSTRVARWTSPQTKLTALGRKELVRLRQRRRRTPVLPTPAMPFYYPTQLRAR